jgi:RimJ/RimL family protein N-acetyltransferase
MDMSPPPPYRIETERLVIRCWQPRDAPLLQEAIEASVDHLRQWMPWAHEEPKTLDERIDLLRHFRGQFDHGRDFIYAIMAPDEQRVLGGTGLHTRVGDDAFEIGYWIRADAVGNGYATEATATLTAVAFSACGVDRVEIHVDPANAASLRIPERLGYICEARLRRRLPPVMRAGLPATWPSTRWWPRSSTSPLPAPPGTPRSTAGVGRQDPHGSAASAACDRVPERARC